MGVSGSDAPGPRVSDVPSEPPTSDGRRRRAGAGSRRRRLVFFSIWGALLLGVVLLFRGVLLPFFLAVVVAYVFAPVVHQLERLRIAHWRMPRWVSVLVLYLGLLGALTAFGVLGVPRLVAEIERLAADAPEAVKAVRQEWIPTLERTLRATIHTYGPVVPEDGVPVAEPAEAVAGVDGGVPAGLDGGVPEAPTASIRIVPRDKGYDVELPADGILVTPAGEGYRITGHAHHVDGGRDLTATITEAIRRASENTEQTAVTLLKTAQTVVRAVVKGVFTFFIMLMLSAYLLITSDRVFAFFRSLIRPERRRNWDKLLRRIDRGLSGVVRGQLLIALVNGVLSGIGFYLLDLNYWPILTLFATLLSVIPIFGAIISSVPAVIVALQSGFGTALLTLAWIVGIHQIEANVLNPKIMGDAAKVHPVLVVFALLAGEHLFGIAGALLAVPVLSIVQSLFLHFREYALGVPRDPSRSQPDLATADAEASASGAE